MKKYAVTMRSGYGYWAVRDTYEEAEEAAKEAKAHGWDGEIVEVEQ